MRWVLEVWPAIILLQQQACLQTGHAPYAQSASDWQRRSSAAMPLQQFVRPATATSQALVS